MDDIKELKKHIHNLEEELASLRIKANYLQYKPKKKILRDKKRIASKRN